MNQPDDVKVFRSVDEFERRTAAEIVRVLREAIRERGVCSLVLSGGTTPAGVYRRCADPELGHLVDWSRVHCFFSDERCVPPEDPLSNFGMAHRELLSRIPVPPENIHRMKGELPPEVGAEAYEDELRTIFHGESPRFDVVLLGVGADGHTASLFPLTDALGAISRWVRAVFVPGMKSWRMTLTFGALNAGREVYILATGEAKAEVLRRAMEGDGPSKELPVTMVRPLEGTMHWMLDGLAASRLGAQPHS